MSSYLNKNINDLKWFMDKKYDFFWKNYSKAFDSEQNNHDFLVNHIKLISASKKAHKAARLAAISALSSSNLEFNVSLSNSKIEDLSKDHDDQIEFEINEDLIKFYEESIKFKKDKKEREKKALLENYEDYACGEQVNLDINLSNKNAPLERAGLKREEELKHLYGDRANEIHLAETSLQIKYDKNFDLYQPKYWPSFPLNLKFN